MILSSQQTQILDELLPVASIALNETPSSSLLLPRTHTLICAPSGSGKSFLMKKLAEILSVPVLLLNVSSWQPLGSRTEDYTWDRIVLFLKENESGVIALDELDKLHGKSEWLGYIRLEIHDLLDGVIAASATVQESSIEDDCWGESSSVKMKNAEKQREMLQGKLRRNMFIVGGGAWQKLWENKRRSKEIGFHVNMNLKSKGVPQKSSICHGVIKHETLQSSISPELLRRFRSSVLLMTPMGKDDYMEILPHFLESLEIKQRSIFKMLAEEQIPDAVEKKLGMRFFEEILTQTLMLRSKMLALEKGSGPRRSNKKKAPLCLTGDENIPF